MARVPQGVVPPDGWHFPVGPGGTKPILTGNDFEDLTKRVLEYRIGNSQRPGNPEAEITEYICTNWPHFCGGGALAAEQPIDMPKPSKKRIPVQKDVAPKNPMSFLERVTSWITIRWRHAGNFHLVDANVAERRAGICARCPMNQEWRNGCPPCVEKNDRELLMLRQNRYTRQHKHLLGCRAAGHDNQTAVWLPEILLRHRKHYQLPSFCWLNELRETKKAETTGAAAKD